MSSLRPVAPLVAVLALTAGAAHAQPWSHTWVSKLGNNSSTFCSQSLPCKTLAGALAKTSAGGLITVLDSGSYGYGAPSTATIIDKSITIDGGSALATIHATSPANAGIIVNAGPGGRVVLRNLSINGFGGEVVGIRYDSGDQLTVQNCTISGTEWGISVQLASTGTLFVTDSHLTRNSNGIWVHTTAGQAFANLDNVRIENVVGSAVRARNNAFVNIFRSTISRGGSTASGVLADTATSMVNVLASSVGFFYGTAINASTAGSTIRLSDSDIMNNVTAIAIAPGAVVESDGTNRVAAFNVNTPPNGVITPQ